MAKRRLTWSWWQLALVIGPVFGVLSAGIHWVIGDPLSRGGVLGFVIMAVLQGIPFGLIMGWWVARTNREAMRETRISDWAGLRAASRTLGRRSIPADSEARAAARRLAVHRLSLARRHLVRTRIVFGLAVVFYLVAAVTLSPWWVLAALFFGGMFVVSLLQPGRMERRIAELGDDPVVAERVTESPVAESPAVPDR